MIPEISLREFLLWIGGKRQRFRITGNSMLPVLKPGEEVLMVPYRDFSYFPQMGDIVVALHPSQPNLHLIKRVTAVLENGCCFLQGDNLDESTDSRAFGWVSPETIIGRVTCRFG